MSFTSESVRAEVLAERERATAEALRLRAEDINYYGNLDLLATPIDVVHTTRELLVPLVCVICHQGPMWASRTTCCGHCGEGKHSPLCSRNFVYPTDGPCLPPETEVKVTLGFLRRLAWSRGDPANA